MKRSILFLITTILVFGSGACSKVAVTGRNQLSLVPESQILSMSAAQYDSFLASNTLSNDRKAITQLQHVGNRIATAVETYLRSHGLSDEADNFAWEFNLVESDQVNAWCMPGGKVVFYTGILPICRDNTGMAVVMGHEVAHAVAHHGQERMSQELLRTVGAVAIDAATQSQSPEARQAWMTAYGLGSEVGVMLPFSRTQETEADHLGIIFMAMAGFDPRTAVSFWERMSQSGGGAPPEFLSTHPSDETRIRNLQKNMDEALTYYSPGK